MEIENRDNNCINAAVTSTGGVFGAIIAKHAPAPSTLFSPSKFGFLSGNTYSASSSSSSSMAATTSIIQLNPSKVTPFSPNLSKSATRDISLKPSGIPSPAREVKSGNSIFGGSIFGGGVGRETTTTPPTSSHAAAGGTGTAATSIMKINKTPQSIQQQKKTPSQVFSMNPTVTTLTTNRTPFSTMQPRANNLSSSISSSISASIHSAPSSANTTPNICNSMSVSNNNCFTPATISFGRTVTSGKSSRENAIASDVSARNAKILSTTEKIQKASEFKEQWKKENEQKLQRIKDQRDRELKKIHEMSLSATESRKKNLEVHRSFEERLKNEERDQIRVYLEDRIYSSNEVESQEKNRRRQSIALRQEILSKSKEAMSMSENKKKDTEREHYEKKNQDFVKLREAKYAEDRRKRESLAFRGEEDRRRKQVQENLDQLSKETENGYLEFRRKVWEDEREYKMKDNKKKRESIAGRLDLWRNQRVAEQEQDELKKLEEKSLFEACYSDWQDIEQYKRKQCERERESLAGRLAKWKQDKAFDVWMRSEAEEAREIEQQLRDQAYEDTKSYEKRQRDMRRQSLAFRLEQAQKASEQERDQTNLQKMLEIEELRLRKLDHDDTDKYTRSLQEAKRKSLHMRNVAAHEDRLREQQEMQEESQKMHESFSLNEQAWRDVKAYQQKMRDEARESMAFRLIEAKKAHEVDLNNHRANLDAVHDELQSKRANWIAVNEYKAGEQEKRRMSVAYRLDSWRKEKIAKEMWRSKQQIERDEDALLKAQDWEDLQSAKREMELKARADVLHTMAF